MPVLSILPIDKLNKVWDNKAYLREKHQTQRPAKDPNMTTQTTTTWTEIIATRSNARQAARTANVFSTASGWNVIEAGIARPADEEETEVIVAEMARFAEMVAEFGIEAEFEASAEAIAQASQAEAASRWAADCRNGFGSF